MEIEKETFKEEVVDKSKLVNLEEENTLEKPAEKELLDTNDSTSKTETSSISDAPKLQKKKKTRCTKCKMNVGCIGKLIFITIFNFFNSVYVCFR